MLLGVFFGCLLYVVVPMTLCVLYMRWRVGIVRQAAVTKSQKMDQMTSSGRTKASSSRSNAGASDAKVAPRAGPREFARAVSVYGALN